MKHFSELAYRHKLAVLVLFVTAFTLLLTSTILLWSEGRRSRELAQAQLHSLANILGATSVAALDFGDAATAGDNLAAARLEPSVMSARLYRADGAPLATYVRPGAEAHMPPKRPGAERLLARGRYMALVEPVVFQGKRFGWIFVEGDIGGTAERLRRYAWTLLLAATIGATVALAIAHRLQRAMTAPIEQLTAAISSVAESGNYSVRVPVQGSDELATLSVGFNRMLRRIEEQDGALRAARASLEHRVEERVQDLRREIREREKTEAALHDSEKKYRSIVENTSEWIWACDAERRWTYHNPTIERILGYRPQDLLGRRFEELLHEEDQDRVAQLFGSIEVLSTGWSGLCLRWRHKDGSYRTIESMGSAAVDSAGQLAGWQGIDRDITDKVSLEEQLRQSQKMEAVGRLAGGVAHDFNNILGVILGYSDLLLNGVVKDAALAKIQHIKNAAERAAGLTRQLLAFSRRQVLEPRVLDLNELILNLAKMLPRLLGEDIPLSLQPGRGLGSIKADPTQVEQVIMNLAVNARDAMPVGGRLEIRTRNVDVDAAFSRAHPPLETGQYVQLTVCDTGHGMDSATMARIFEPFFTTKAAGKGTGLGLATVYGIVKQSGGHVFVESKPGAGTTFDVYLPRIAGPGPESESGPKEPPAPRGSETVLLAEDEDSLRTLVAETLESLGYRVIAAADGQEALRLARAEPTIDILLTDVVMPGMSGRELAEALRIERPETRVLYMSGYTDDAVLRHGVVKSESLLIQKPFTSQLLATRLREAMAAPNTGHPDSSASAA